MTTYLRDLVSVEAFKKALASGHISERPHASDAALRVYSYTPKTQFSGFWTPETRLARGLMLSVPESGIEDAAVVGRGLPKFFTIEQVGTDWGRMKLVDDDEGVTVEEAAELPWDAPAFVAEKLNGALGLAYAAPDGLAISTKGSFASLEAGIGTAWIRRFLAFEDQERFISGMAGSTALFEIITPERPHPVDYGNTEALFFLGAVEHATGTWTPADETHFLVSELGFQLAPRLEQATLREAMALPYRENTEGLVVTIQEGATQHLYKVKPKEYLELRRAFYAAEVVDLSGFFSKLSSAEVENLTVDDLPFPAHIRDREARIREAEESILVPLRVRLAEVRAEYKRLRGDELPARPDFARLVKTSSEASALLFKAYDEDLNGSQVLAAPVLAAILKSLKKA